MLRILILGLGAAVAFFAAAALFVWLVPFLAAGLLGYCVIRSVEYKAKMKAQLRRPVNVTPHRPYR
jgi:uncharacterized membrane protein YbhN (UPF0104 family)